MLAQKTSRGMHSQARLRFDHIHELKHVHHTRIDIKVHIDTRPPSMVRQAAPIIIQQLGRAYLD
jgi:hypothetical protein